MRMISEKRAGRMMHPAALLAASGMLVLAGGCGIGAQNRQTKESPDGAGAGVTADVADLLAGAGGGAEASGQPQGAEGSAGASGQPQGAVPDGQADTEASDAGAPRVRREGREGVSYEAAPSDLILWYEGDSYTAYFQLASERYYGQTGVKVEPQLRSGSIDYLGDIYDATMADEAFPDLYLLSGDNLEEAYLYGLAAVNTRGTEEAGVVPAAAAAASYGDKLLGYPLNYNTCVFVFQSDYFGNAPQSLQEIIDYSEANDPAENVEYLLEWDVNDPFYDFPFVSNSVTFEKKEAETMTVLYDEELYRQDLEYFEGILESFSVDAARVSEDSIVENFLAGRTLSAIIDTDSLGRLSGYGYSLMKIPDLNETLTANACSVTEMIVVNDFTEEEEAAADFAYFATVAMAEELHGMSGHYSVIPSADPDWAEQVALDAYASAVPAPDSQDAKDFWVDLKETILKYF